MRTSTLAGLGLAVFAGTALLSLLRPASAPASAQAASPTSGATPLETPAPASASTQAKAVLSAPTQRAAGARLQVRVVGPQGRPVPRARLALRCLASGAVRGQTCNDSGLAALALEGRGPFELIALADGFLVPKARRVAPPFSETIELRLVAGRELEVQVEGPSGPLAGVELELEGGALGSYLAPDAPARTNASGRALLTGLPARGPSELVARLSGFAAARATASASDRSLRLVLRPLQLRVELDTRGAAPRSDLVLELRLEADASTRRVPMRSSALECSLEREGRGWARLVQSGDQASPWTAFETSASTPSATLNLALAGRAPLSGQVCDAQGEPLAGALVVARSLVGGELRTRSEADGSFELSAREGAAYVVEARASGLAPYRTRASAPEPYLILVLGPLAPVVSRPLLTGAGRPQQGSLRFEPGPPDPHSDEAPPSPFEVALDPQGRADLASLPAGQWTVSFHEPAKDELRAWILEAEVDPQRPLTLQLGAAAQSRVPLEGRVWGAPSDTLVQVDLRPAELKDGVFAFVAAKAVNPDGSFAFGQVPPGRYLLRAEWDEGRSAALEVSVDADRAPLFSNLHPE